MNKHINYYFLFLSVFLIVFGALFLAALSAPQSLQTFGNTNYYSFRHLIRIAIGFVLAVIALKIPLSFLKRIAPIILFVNMIFLVIVFLPMLGLQFWGAKRWISIGSITFQPSEFLKITSILYLASWLSNRVQGFHKKKWNFNITSTYDNLKSLFIPFLIFLGIITAILYFQKDLSTLIVICAALIIVYFMSGTPAWHMALIVIGGIITCVTFILTEPFRIKRLMVFFQPEIDPLGIGLHLKQSLIALGSGGIFGRGLGLSTQKFGFLPQPMSDSIFAVLGEETGIVGSLVLIALFLAFLWMGYKIAFAATDKFAKLTAVGITTWIVLQAFINIGSTMGLFPMTGIPLPFFSYGGSHIIAEMMGVGLLLNISKNG